MSLVNRRLSRDVLAGQLFVSLGLVAGSKRLVDCGCATARDSATQDANGSGVDVLLEGFLAGQVLVGTPALDGGLYAFGHAFAEATLEGFHGNTANALAALEGVHDFANGLGISPGIDGGGSNTCQPHAAQGVLLARQSGLLHGVTVDGAQFLGGIEECVGSRGADRAVDSTQGGLNRSFLRHVLG